jgi:CDP-4-dehydro-6-deoxyglucose reductase
MTAEISIRPSDHTFTAEDGDTVLAAAMRAELMIPYGCRNGACGTCKGRILEGEVDFGAHQPSTLTDDEKRRGLALFCVAKPKTDLVIEVREVRKAGDIEVKRLPCRIESIDKRASDVAVVKLKLPVNERLQYLAGQYLDFVLKDGHRRSFSIATPPHADELLELHIRHTPGGFFTDQLFNTFKGREILRFEGPLGTFYLREDSDKPMIFVAGGTGFAPIKAQLEHLFHHGDDRPKVLYWGARARKDLYLPEAPLRWQQEHPEFSYVPVLSDPRPEDQWQGRTGFVHQAVLDDFPGLANYQVYACGAPAMTDLARQTFVEQRDLPEDEFYCDAFTPSVDAKK